MHESLPNELASLAELCAAMARVHAGICCSLALLSLALVGSLGYLEIG